MADGTIEMAFVFKAVDNLSGVMGKMRAEMATTESRTKKLGIALSNIGSAVLPIVGLAVARFAQESIDLAIAFDETMSKVSALTGEVSRSTPRWQNFEQALRDVAMTTQYTATQIGDAAGFMAMAGFTLDEIEESIDNVTQLATVGFVDLGTAADITTNIMTGFGLTVQDLNRVNDVLAATFTSSNTSLTMLGETMKYAAPVATSVGIGIEQVAAAAGLLGNAGIQASMAGTGLRMAIAQVLTPTGTAEEAMNNLGISFINASGEVDDFVTIIRKLEESQASAADVMNIFGTRAGTTMLALLNQGSVALEDFTLKLRNSEGATASMSEEIEKSMAFRMKELQSRMQEVQITIGEALYPAMEILTALMADTFAPLLKDTLVPTMKELVPIIRLSADILTDMLEPLKGNDKAIKALILTWATYKAGVIGASIVNSSFVRAIGVQMLPALSSLKTSLGTTGMAALGVGLAVGGIMSAMMALNAESVGARAMFSLLTGVMFGLSIASFAAAAGMSAANIAMTAGVAAAAIAAGLFLVSSAMSNMREANNVPSGASGAVVQESGLMYVHAGERKLDDGTVMKAAKVRRYSASERTGGFSSGGDTYNINLSAGAIAEKQQVAQMIVRAIKEAKQDGRL